MAEKQTKNHVCSVPQAWHESKSYCSLKQPTSLQHGYFIVVEGLDLLIN